MSDFTVEGALVSGQTVALPLIQVPAPQIRKGFLGIFLPESTFITHFCTHLTKELQM